VTRRRVRFTATAQKQLRELKLWWQENSAHAEILPTDLDQALRMLSVLPGIGSPYPYMPIPGLRRFYLDRLVSHLYYTFDERELIIQALWHARRGSGPDFRSA
jgi:plasmid stabilization system protein ParE